MHRWIALFSWLLIIGSGAAAAEQLDVADLSPLFAANSTVDIELETDLRNLLNTRREPGFQPGVLRWRADGDSGELAVGVSPRGRFRLDRENCQFPPLFLELPADAAGLFTGLQVVPVTTHCATGMQYVVQEYLLYRAFGLLTESSVAARLARTRYVDSTGRGRPIETVSFFTEHFESVGRRVRAQVVEDARISPGETEPRATALVDIFQYMIGNTDWSILAQHNIALLRTEAGVIIPLPYDFDFAGVINARYAVPSEKLRIRSVTQRQYRGFCQHDTVVRAAIAHLGDRRQAIYDLYRRTPELDSKIVKRSLRYYDKFFEIADSPEALRREILETCREIPSPRSRTEADDAER